MSARFHAILALWHLAIAIAMASVVPCGPGFRGVDGNHGIAHPVPLRAVDSTRMREMIRAGASTDAGVSVVVPVYRELASGNLARLLEGFSKQSAAARNFELVLVVNNTPELVRDATPTGAATFRENQDTLKVLEFVRNRAAPDPEVFGRLDAGQVAVFRLVREKGIGLRVVDKSSAGTERNIGEIRNFGVDDVMTRFPVGEKKRIIAMLDADTGVPHDYVENIMVHFATRPIDALFLPMEYRIEPGSEQWVYESSVASRNEPAVSLFDRALNADARHGGPQIVATNDAMKTVGGVPRFTRGEDSMLSQALGKLRIGHAADTRVLTADRARPDGYDSKKRFDEGESGYAPIRRPFFPTPFLAGRTVHTLQLKNQMTEARLDKLFQGLNMPFTGKEFLARRATMVRDTMMTTLERSPATTNLLRDYRLGPFSREEFKKLDLDPEVVFAHDGVDTVKRALILYITGQGKEWNEAAWTRHMTDVKFPRYYNGHAWSYQVLESLKQDKFKGTGDPPWEIALSELLRRKLPATEFGFYDAQTKQERDAHNQGTRMLTVVLFSKVDGRTNVPVVALNDPLVREFFEGNTWLAPYIARRRAEGVRPADLMVEIREQFPDWFQTFDSTPFKKRLTETTVLTRMIREAEDHPERYPELWNLLRTIRGE